MKNNFFMFGFGVINLNDVMYFMKVMDNDMRAVGVEAMLSNGTKLLEKCDEETANDILKQVIENND